MINTVKFANPIGQGPLREIIGWIDFCPNFNLKNNQPENIINILPNGYEINFTLLFSSPDEDLSLIAIPAPIANTSEFPFGNTSYTDINGNVILYYSRSSTSSSTLSISNIRVNKINSCEQCLPPDYSFIVADAQASTIGEIWQVSTNGSPWIFIKNMRSLTGLTSAGPGFIGIGTQTVREIGFTNNVRNITAGTFLTNNPTALSFNFVTDSSQAAVALGIIVNHTPTYNNVYFNY